MNVYTVQLVLVSSMLFHTYPAGAQWSQTLGWGGAGNGKRAIEKPHSYTYPCPPKSRLTQLIINLIQLETGRRHRCDDDDTLPAVALADLGK